MRFLWKMWDIYAHWCEKHHAAGIAFVIGIIGIPSSLHFIFGFPGSASTPPPSIPIQSLKEALFIRPSDDGISQQLSSDLQNSGIHVAPNETDDGLALQIENSVVEGPTYDSSNSELAWSAIAKAQVVIRNDKNNALLVNQPFSATTNPPTDSPDTAVASAKQQLAARISDYLYQNRARFNFQN